jgi:Pentapeptide repeats (8 copies)
MPKRWAALPRDIRWTIGGIAAVVLALVVACVLFVPAADWLAHHDVGSITGVLHETALDNAQGRLLTLGAGLFAAGALVFTARNFTLSREGQVTDRYTKAVEQLGSDKLDVRIGGIYALERVARDSARDHAAVIEVLTAFIRDHSHGQWPVPEHHTDPAAPRATCPDVQAALTVVGRRDVRRDIRPIDLSGANLLGANLSGPRTTRGFRASRQREEFPAQIARWVHYGGADLTGANLTGADLSGANLTDALLGDADLTDANLTIALLGGANLTGAQWSLAARVPGGWRLDPGSGRLERAGTGSGPTEAG